MTPEISSTDSDPTGFCSQMLWGLTFLVLRTWAGGALCEAGTPHSQDIPPKFLSTTHGCGTRLFCVSTSPTSLDGWSFFNSIVVRLPFNSISDGSEWWLFYILIVTLIWLCKEAKRVYLCHLLDQKSSHSFFKKYFMYVFLEREGGREKERERNINVREKH